MHAPRHLASPRTLIDATALAGAYALFAILATTLGRQLGIFAPIWPAAGVAVAALLIGGVRLWPGIIVGASIAAAIGPDGLTWDSFIAAAGTAAASVIVAAALARTGFRRDLRRVRDVVSLVIASALGAAITASIGMASVRVFYPEWIVSSGPMWRTWWLGDSLGILLIAPVVLTLVPSVLARTERSADAQPTLSPWEGTAYAVAVAACIALLLAPSTGWESGRTMAFLVFPVLIWGAIRIGIRATVGAAALVGTAAIVGATAGATVLSRAQRIDAIGFAQSLLASAMVTALVVVASTRERRDATTSLGESQRHLSLVNESTTDRVALLEIMPDGTPHLAFANSAFASPLSADAERTTLLSRSTDVRVEELVRVARDRASMRVERASSDLAGAPISEITIIPSISNTDRVSHVLWSARDISERRRVEDELRIREFAIELAPLAALVIDETGRVLVANAAAATLSGRDRGELLDGNVAEWLSLGQGGWPATWLELRTARQAFRDLEVVRDDGSHVAVQLSAALFMHAGREVSCAFLADVSHRKRDEERRITLEAALMRAQKMEALGTLAGGIAHDFNNILAGILGNAELARLALGAEHPVSSDDLSEILRAVQRARDLVRQILTFSRRERFGRMATPLAAVMEEAHKLLRASLPSTMSLALRTADEDPNVLADPSQIHQVVMNLVTNAAHAIGTGVGRIAMVHEVVEVPESLATLHQGARAGSHVRLSVIDDGQGMDTRTIERIFEPFFTTKAAGTGTGLGLAMVHGIVHDHDGFVTVESAPGRGATFRVHLPVTSTQAVAAPALIDTLARGAGEHILLVDDEEAVARVSGRLLERLGYRVTRRSDPRAALALFQSMSETFDAVITDLTMPAMTGIQLARAIRAVRPELPVLIMTGFGGEQLAADAASAGVVEILAKPVQLELLGGALARVLARTTVAS